MIATGLFFLILQAESVAKVPAPEIPVELQLSWRASVIDVNMAQAEVNLAQAQLKLLKAQKAQADQTAKVFSACGEKFEAQVSAPEAPIICSPKRIKE